MHMPLTWRPSARSASAARAVLELSLHVHTVVVCCTLHLFTSPAGVGMSMSRFPGSIGAFNAAPGISLLMVPHALRGP